MRISSRDHNRCFVFLFSDPDGIVDDYVPRLLESFREEARYILTVCNGPVRPDHYPKLARLADEVLIRVDVGLDVGAYREALFHLGWKFLEQFDELVLVNDTFFGPVPSFRPMFEEMAGRDVDFWGITAHARVPYDPFGGKIRYGYLPEHLNSDFLALRRSLFASQAYRDFIFSLPNPLTPLESALRYDVVFTKHFSDLGYAWEAYADASGMAKAHYYPLLFGIQTMLDKCACPIVPRQSLYIDYNELLISTAGESSAEVYDYLKAHPELYDLGLVWDNTLRLHDLADVLQVMHMKVFPDSETTGHDFTDDREALVAVFGSEQLFRTLCARYDRAIPANWKRVWLDGGGTWAEKLWETARLAEGYRYVCVLDPFHLNAYGGPDTNIASLMYREMENTVGSHAAIGNLIEAFREEDRLGMLVPPVPNHGVFFEKVRDGWLGRLEDVKTAARRLGMTVPVRKTASHPVFPLGGSLWIRRDVLTALTERYPDPPDFDDELMRMLLPYLLQEMRCLTKAAISTRYAANEATNLDYMTRENNKAVFSRVDRNYYHVVLAELKELSHE